MRLSAASWATIFELQILGTSIGCGFLCVILFYLPLYHSNSPLVKFGEILCILRNALYIELFCLLLLSVAPPLAISDQTGFSRIAVDLLLCRIFCVQ